jgi:hypothetical protein
VTLDRAQKVAKQGQLRFRKSWRSTVNLEEDDEPRRYLAITLPDRKKTPVAAVKYTADRKELYG